VKSFVVFEMKIWFICTVEQIDIVLDTLNLLAVTRDGEAEYLKFAYTVLFGCSSVASVCVVIAFLRLLVIRLRMRFTTYARFVSTRRCIVSSSELVQNPTGRKDQIQDDVGATADRGDPAQPHGPDEGSYVLAALSL
jgi:hypothetical protein